MSMLANISDEPHFALGLANQTIIGQTSHKSSASESEERRMFQKRDMMLVVTRTMSPPINIYPPTYCLDHDSAAL